MTAPEAETRLAAAAELALACVDRPYPFQLVHALAGEADAAPPGALHPVFSGCFDWHSAVHAHWLLARTARLAPEHAVGRRAHATLARRLRPEALAAEADYVGARPTFERPYGLAWLLALDAELHGLAAHAPEAAGWAAALGPVVAHAVRHLAVWLERLPRPVRVGTHAQTAFASALVLDWARARGQRGMEALVGRRSLDFHLGDVDLPLHLEPSGEDFLSPALGVADLMRRLLAPEDFGGWLSAALPGLGADPPPLAPLPSPDPTDGRLAHLDGLLLSRAWMLRGVAAGLPGGDPRGPALRALADAHEAPGLAALGGGHYAGAHWLGTFAGYLVSEAWNTGGGGGNIPPP